jgi:transaldolase
VERASTAHDRVIVIVADTVNTMPEKTLPAFADHGEAEGDKVTAPPRGHRRCSTPSNASASKPRLVSE